MAFESLPLALVFWLFKASEMFLSCFFSNAGSAPGSMIWVVPSISITTRPLLDRSDASAFDFAFVSLVSFAFANVGVQSIRMAMDVNDLNIGMIGSLLRAVLNGGILRERSGGNLHLVYLPLESFGDLYAGNKFQNT